MNFLYFTSFVSYRIPIADDGTLGQPEILSKFTKETYASKKKKKEPTQLVSEEATEEQW